LQYDHIIHIFELNSFTQPITGQGTIQFQLIHA
jgi:hypothetical protein